MRVGELPQRLCSLEDNEVLEEENENFKFEKLVLRESSKIFRAATKNSFEGSVVWDGAERAMSYECEYRYTLPDWCGIRFRFRSFGIPISIATLV
jgi:hypothetical protein